MKKLLIITKNLWGVSDKGRRKALPSKAYFKQGLYMFDVGQNDIDAEFSSKSEDQVVASIPSILAEFETGLKVIYKLFLSTNSVSHNRFF